MFHRDAELGRAGQGRAGIKKMDRMKNVECMLSALSSDDELTLSLSMERARI